MSARLSGSLSDFAPEPSHLGPLIVNKAGHCLAHSTLISTQLVAMPDMQLQGTGEEPLASLPLMPPRPPISYHKPDLDIITANDHVIQLIDPTASPYHVTARHLTHKEHRFVLNYTVVGVSTGWTVSVYDNSGLLVVEYTFALKLAALKFQEYITGYKPLACIEQTACSAIFEARLGKGQFKRPRYHGEGEIQLWCPEGLVDEAFISPPASLFRVSTSSTGVSARGSMFRTNGGPSKPNTPVVHHHRHRSPLLVAFLCGEGGYTMLRAKSRSTLRHYTVPQLTAISQRPEMAPDTKW